MNKEELAALLDGREYGNEITSQEEKQAKQDGLVVVFGYSDDICELRGAINDEIGCFDGGTISFTKNGKFPTEDEIGIIEDILGELKLNRIKAIFAPQEPLCSWIYETDIPHATFNIMENGELYCVGIVFSINDLIKDLENER